MSIRTTVRSPGAIVLGALCFIGTMVVLFWEFVEAWSLAGFSQSHVYILAALVVAYGAGHFMLTSCEWSIGGIVRPIAFGVLFVVATAICVGLSGARTSESFARKENVASNENAKRTRHEGLIAEANVDRQKAHKAADEAEADAKAKAKKAADACEAGVRCKALTATSDAAKTNAAEKLKLAQQADSHYWVLTAQLSQFKAPEIANANLKQVAKAIAFVRSHSLDANAQALIESRVMEGLLLYLPYAFALLTEFGSIAFFNWGFGHRKENVATVETDTSETVDTPLPVEWAAALETQSLDPTDPPTGGGEPRKPRATRTSVSGKPSSTVVNGPWRKRPMAEAKALAFVRERLAKGERFPSQKAIARRTGVTKGCVSKWLDKWEVDGIIVRSRDGRCNVIGSAPARLA